MKFIESVEQTGIIPDYHLENEIDNLMINPNKPSGRVLNTKIGIKTIALLKKIERDVNHSWYTEIKNRNTNNLDKCALFYRANKISYKEMFEKADKYAKSMVALGIKKGDEIPCCIANVPEVVYIMLAANKIGARLNLFGPQFDKDYINEIINGTSKKLLFITDDFYDELKDKINVEVDNIVAISLADSLPENPELCDEYEPELSSFYNFENKVPFIKQHIKAMSQEEFLTCGERINDDEIIDNNSINEVFTITYTSGSTRIGFPKPLIHTNRSYIIGGIYNDSNLTGSPEVPEIRGLAHIHTESNTDLITSISDNLMKRGCVAFEPIYNKKTFLESLIINKPVHVDATTSFFLEAAKEYLVEGKMKNRKLPFMLASMAVGERTMPSEEKFINKFLKKAKAGSGISLNGIRLPYAPLSVGGGDCEHGGIFYTLLKGLQEKTKILVLRGNEYGMTPAPFATVTALKLNQNGEYEECEYNEYGVLVGNSITSMKGYKNNKEKTLGKIIRDKYGRDWLSLDVYGCINNVGNAIVKGRAEDYILCDNGIKIPCFAIDDVVCKDTKNVLSCSTVVVKVDGRDIPVINVELSPLKQKSDIKVLEAIKKRIEQNFSYYILDNAMIRIIDNDNSYPLHGSGKRNLQKLKDMFLYNTFKLNYMTERQDYGTANIKRKKTI